MNFLFHLCARLSYTFAITSHDLLSGLNEPQQQAVTHDTGPLLIFAGAGSGKTRTLTHRIAYLIGERQISPNRILAVTFTNKAAKEMRERLEVLIGPIAKRMWLGTFHALCARMLRVHGENIGINPRFAIFDTDDSSRLIKEILKDLNLDTQRFPPARVLGKISDAKNALKTVEQVATEATQPHQKVYAQLYGHYQRRLREVSALDFDDLLTESVRLLQQSPPSLEHWSERFQHVLIDEFQDVNEAQFQWARMLASKHGNICVVGDDDQCLAAGTLVTTPDGDKPIEDIREGDLVLSGVGEGEARFYPVKKASAKSYRGPMLRVESNSGCILRATPNHICFGFPHCGEPIENEILLFAFSYYPHKEGTFLHEVHKSDKSQYFADENIDNADEVARQMARSNGGLEIKRFASFTPKRNLRFRSTSDLKVSMQIPVTKGTTVELATITDITEEHYDGYVYDLDVPLARNFAANGVLVHNSIYAWRGANVQIILDFEKRYPDAKVVRLEQNYRSTQNILDAAYGVISNNLGRADKKLWSEEKGGEEIVLHGSYNAVEEASWVVRQIEILMREEKISYSDCAILCRVNAQSRPFEEAFMRSRVPLKLVGTQRFYERREIRDVMAYLKFLYNPDDSVSAVRLINTPPRGIGAVTITKLQEMARGRGVSLGAILLDKDAAKELTPAIQRKIEPLRLALKHIFNDANGAQTLADLVERVLERTQFLEYLENSNEKDNVDRVANVEEFVRAAESFDLRLAEELDETGETGEDWDEKDPLRLGQFLAETALQGGTDKDAQSDDAVTLMTLHAAKGLEFPIVFLVGLEQGLLPHARAVFSDSATEEELEEERRLMYVGLTRARKRAILTFAAQRTLHGRTETTMPSQFIEEIPAHLLRRSGVAGGGSPIVQQRRTSWGNDDFKSLPRPSSASTPAPTAATPSAPSAPATSSRRTFDKPATFKVGDKLRHNSYGEGLVVAASAGGGAGEWVEVAFLSGDTGKKKLIVAYANLEKVE